jgi:hypothetical protein
MMIPDFYSPFLGPENLCRAFLRMDTCSLFIITCARGGIGTQVIMAGWGGQRPYRVISQAVVQSFNRDPI